MRERDDDLITGLAGGHSEAMIQLAYELRPAPHWYVRWPLALAVIVAGGLAGHYGTGLVLELSTRLEIAWSDSSWQAPPPPDLPPEPFGHP